jgi:hypothetical protein
MLAQYDGGLSENGSARVRCGLALPARRLYPSSANCFHLGSSAPPISGKDRALAFLRTGIAEWGGQLVEKPMTRKKLIKITAAVSTFACTALLSVGASEQHGVSLSVDSAQARVGRPLTPGSVAGVARRQNRRAAYGYGYGAGAAGAAALATAGVVAAATAPAYWGGQSTTWGNAYAAQTDPRFGQPHYVTRAYYEGSPYYGYSGWEDYSARNFLKCRPGTLTKLEDGRMYPCQ